MFGADRQVYYRAVKKEERQKLIAQQIIMMVRNVRLKMPRIGARKLYYLLHTQLRELKVGRDRLFEILRANHLLIEPKRQYQITTNSHHRFRKHKNLIENLRIKRPEQVWVSDITYVGTRDHPMYLALVTDAYSKKIMGHNLSDSLNVKGSVNALNMALKNRKYKSVEMIHHSDRGLQYCSNDYQELLNKENIKCSMTEKYDPYQNAVAERVNGILKQEFIKGIHVKEIKLMSQLINESINIYNDERPHLSCSFKTPKEMHNQKKIEIKTYKNKNRIKASLDPVN